ncbi:13973_t:CDS:1, partial [Funneliformis mosseae]
VNEGQKNIIGQQIIKVAESICIFGEIYEATIEGIFGNWDVKVYVGKSDDKWNYLKEGFYDEISLMLELGLKYI